jgi:hypothetical protein
MAVQRPAWTIGHFIGRRQEEARAMNRLKTVGVAGALVGSALLGGTLISAAMAAPNTSAPTGSATSDVVVNLGVSDTYLDAYLDALAAELGVDRSELGPAALSAAEAAIDAAEKAGDIDADRATELRDRLASLDDPERLLAGGGAFGPGRGPGGHGFGIGADLTDAAAAALGLETDALLEALHDGSSLEEIAADQAVDYATVKTAVTDAASEQLATAVADERITQDRADEILADLQTWLDDGGQPGEGGFGPGFRMHGPRMQSDDTGDTDSSSS